MIRAMQTAVARERETRPGDWVQAAMDARHTDDAHVAVLVGRHPTTVYRWRKAGIDYVAWVGLLNLLGLPPTWEPGHVAPKLPDDWELGDPIPATKGKPK
jgi:hypothetical protein